MTFSDEGSGQRPENGQRLQETIRKAFTQFIAVRPGRGLFGIRREQRRDDRDDRDVDFHNRLLRARVWTIIPKMRHERHERHNAGFAAILHRHDQALC
jgi:hypothetical protein